ncbi:carbon storage regulator [Candidatus Saccharibacteria bacterium]|nr:carbon storage regulator [Candidatus Saccharibacteria bacterium]
MTTLILRRKKREKVNIYYGGVKIASISPSVSTKICFDALPEVRIVREEIDENSNTTNP